MNEHDFLAQRFEAHRTHLRAVAYRMLGSLTEADDAVQDAWLRLMRSQAEDIDRSYGAECAAQVFRRASNTAAAPT